MKKLDRTKFRWVPGEWPDGIPNGPWEGRRWDLLKGNDMVAYVIKYASGVFPTESIVWLRTPHTIQHETMIEAAKAVEEYYANRSD